MPLEFRSSFDPTGSIVDDIAALTPENPFYTREYLQVRQKLGAEPCVFWLEENGSVVAGCSAFLTRGRLNARIEITSFPSLPDRDLFWNELFGFCRKEGVSVLGVHTFASAETAISESKGRLMHWRRSEYRQDLTAPDLWEIMNRRHHRLIRKARGAGIRTRRSNDPQARAIHVGLANLSLDRRRKGGAHIDSQIELADVDAFIECGAGEIYQAVLGDEVCSSILIAKSRTGGYAQSSGTSDAGRGLGTSHFLFYEAACQLKSDGLTVFNLGGADEHSVGLQEFKLGLGSVRIELESAEFYTGSVLKKYATKAIGLIKLIG